MYFSTSGNGGNSGMGLGCAECVGTCGNRGMGSIDLSSLSWEDYLLVGILGALVFMPAGGGSKRRGKKSPGFAATDWALTAVAVGGFGYLAYRYFFAGPTLVDP